MGGVWHARLVLGCLYSWVPIYIFAEFVIRMEMGANIFMGCLLSRFYGSTSCTCVFNLDFHSVLPTWVHGFQVDCCLLALQSEVENFVLRMAAEFPDRNEQLIFLINNYDMMLTVLLVGRLLPKPLTPSPPHPLTPSHSHPLTPLPPPSSPPHTLHPHTPSSPFTPSHPTVTPLPPPSSLPHLSHTHTPSSPFTPSHPTVTPSLPQDSHLLNPSPPLPLSLSPLTHFHLLMALTPSLPQTLTLSPTHPSTLTPQLPHPLTSHSLPPSPPLQERTSEESKESESFKSLLHARTQEFVQEVRVFIRTWYVHGMCVRACVRVCVHV